VQILDKYLQAIGGAQRAATLTSYVAKGMYSGYGPEGVPRPVEIYAKAPNQKTTVARSGGATTSRRSTAWPGGFPRPSSPSMMSP
jgi:hypothetical protein